MSGSTNTHARLSPSSSNRWIHCTSSVKAIEAAIEAGKIKPDESSIYAEEGTRAHDYAEEVLTGKIKIDDVPTKGDEDFPNSDFHTPVKVYVDHCHSLVEDDTQVFVEEKVPLFYREDQTGTVDYAAVSDAAIHIRDYKHGAGILVDAEENTQSAIYAKSLIKHLSDFYDFTGETVVTIGIVQPRYAGHSPISIWETTVAELDVFIEHIQASVDVIDKDEETVFCPTEKGCFFCPLKGICKARASEALDALPDMDVLNDDEPDFESHDTDFLTDEQVLRIFKFAKEINKVVTEACNYVQERADDGNPIEGTKIVKGRMGNRAWADVDAAEKWLSNRLLRDDRYTFKLISPTQAEKALKDDLKARVKTNFEKLITRSEGKNVAVLESDKRPAVENPVEALENLPDDEEDMFGDM